MAYWAVGFMDLFQELIKLPSQGIYGFFNSNDKRFYIGYSVNLPNALPQVIQRLESSNKVFNNDKPRIQFRLIEPILNKDALRMRHAYWVKFYKGLGYLPYKEPKVCNYKLRIDVVNETLGRGTGKYHFYVKLVSRGYRELVVGVFDNVLEMETFISDHYKEVNNIIYSSNSLTNDYLKHVQG